MRMNEAVAARAAQAAERWAVVQSKPSEERLAKENLQNQGFEVYLPLMLRTTPPSKRNPKGGVEVGPFLPRYMFVRLDPSVQAWTCIFSTRGVRQVLMAGQRPGLISDGVVQRIRAREEGGFIKMLRAEDLPRNFKHGDSAKLAGAVLGIDHDIDVLFESYVDSDRVKVLFTIFGRETRAVVSALLVK